MREIKYGKILIDPQINPAILDTATWDIQIIKGLINKNEPDVWKKIIEENLNARYEKFKFGEIIFYTGSSCVKNDSLYLLLEYPDRQHSILAVSNNKIEDEIGEPFWSYKNEKACLTFYKADIDTLHNYFLKIDKKRGPRALGYTPRLGIGTRMSTAMWPAIYDTMQNLVQPSNTIQNSLRELRLLSDVFNGEKPKLIHLYSFGYIEEGHTGSTFEGLWLEGVLYALKRKDVAPYGADADHIRVDDCYEGIKRTKKILDAARYYTFYTIDVSNIIKYEYMISNFKGRSEEALKKINLSKEEIEKLYRYHEKTSLYNRDKIMIDKDILNRFLGKYWEALNALEELDEYITKIKKGEEYDLELSIDEFPGNYEIKEILTRPEEVLLLIREFQRRNIHVTHLAPNFGVEKGVDYRMAEGLEELGKRIQLFYRICQKEGVMLDCHSGDDLSSETRKTFSQATEGNLHFKISPSLQEIFAETLFNESPASFGRWWQKTLEYAKEQSSKGSSFAQECIDKYYKDEKSISDKNMFFHYYYYAPIGKYDKYGRLELRDMFYSVPQYFYNKYNNLLKKRLTLLCNDLFKSRESK